MVLDNINEIKKLLEFKPDTVYAFFVLNRKKDSNKYLSHTDCVKYWLIDSEQELGKLYPDMKTICDKLSCRLYVTVNAKSKKKILMGIREKIDSIFDQLIYKDDMNLSSKAIGKIVTSAQRLCRIYLSFL